MDRGTLCYKVGIGVWVNKREWKDEGNGGLSKLSATSSHYILCSSKNFFPPRLLSFTSSNASDFGFSSQPSENVLALYAFFNQWITQDSFRPSLDIIKWLTDIIGFTASPEHPSSPPLTPVHFCESQSLTQRDMWQSELIYNKFRMKRTFPCWFCYFFALKEK